MTQNVTPKLIAGSSVTQGYADGSLRDARFDCLGAVVADKNNNCLYVADTSNHCIRKIDLATRTVSTVRTPTAHPAGWRRVTSPERLSARGSAGARRQKLLRLAP